MVKNNMFKAFLFLVILLSFACVNTNAVSKVLNNESIKQDKILDIEKRSQFLGYVIKDNELYLGFWVDTDGKQGKTTIYKYENKKLKDLKLSEQESEKFLQTKITRSDEMKDTKIEIKPNLFFKISNSTLALNFYDMFLIKDGREKNITNGKYYAYLNHNYVYIDAPNEKIYFFGGNLKDGFAMYTYNINENKFKLLRPLKTERDKDNNVVEISFENPNRVPNTAYLIYIAKKDTSYSDDSTKNTGMEVLIEEIPEWKAEIEAKGKSK